MFTTPLEIWYRQKYRFFKMQPLYQQHKLLYLTLKGLIPNIIYALGM